MLAKLQEQLHSLLQALGLLNTPQLQPLRISEAEQARLRQEARRHR